MKVKYHEPCGMMMFHVYDAPIRVIPGSGVEIVFNDSLDHSSLTVFMSLDKLKELQFEIKGALKTWQRTQSGVQ